MIDNCQKTPNIGVPDCASYSDRSQSIHFGKNLKIPGKFLKVYRIFRPVQRNNFYGFLQSKTNVAIQKIKIATR